MRKFYKDAWSRAITVLNLSKIILLIIIFISISEFYFERISYLRNAKQIDIILMEEGEVLYKGKKIVWDEMNEKQKENHRLKILKTENRIKFNRYLISEHLYNLLLDILAFASLFILKRWVKLYLIFWALSGFIIIPGYHYIIGYDSLMSEQFALFTFGMKIAFFIIIFGISTLYLFLGRHIFKLIDIRSEEHIKTFKRGLGKKARPIS